MFRPLSSRSIALIVVAFTAAGFSFGSTPTRIVPAKGEKITFRRTYSAEHLKSHPLQLVTKTDLTLKNTKGLLTATWNATYRDIRTDEKIAASATAICKAHGSRKIECTFDAATGSVNLSAQSGGVLLTIPVGQGVLITAPEKDGIVRSEFLLGADEENSSYRLNK